MKILKRYVIPIAVFLSTVTINLSYAENLSVEDKNKMLGAVSKEWESSNLREWLNSDKDIVEYTSLPPSYKDEEGFLSNKNFTEEERNAIAITKHSGAWQYSINNSNSTLYVSQRGLVREDFVYNDKVFILNYSDIFNFIERNDKLMELNKKYYSKHIQENTNKLNKYPYLVNSGYVNNSYENTNRMYNTDITGTPGGMEANIVPALSLKPDYIFPNGEISRDLKVGSLITFGKYNNEPITWRVINKSESGYPLLFSEDILTVKEYDAPGDINPLKSKYINFSNHDVSILSDETKTVSWETGKIVNSFPEIIIHNEEELTSPSTKDSIVAQISITDKNNEITEVVLPNGNTVHSSELNYTITKNGGYLIKAKNSEGVITVRHFMSGALNQPLELILDTDTTEQTKWINKPININVSTNKKDNVYELFINGEHTIQGHSIYPEAFPSSMSLGGKRLRVTGTLKNLITDEDIQRYNLDMNAKIIIRLDMISYDIFKTFKKHPQIKTISLQELKDAGEINLDFTITIDPSYFSDLVPVISLMNTHSDYIGEGYRFIVKDFKYEILDKDDSELKYITLPNGEKVESDTASYTINKKGTYTFKAEDNRGKIVTKSITVNLDENKPKIKINSTEEKDFIRLSINAKDDLSGIKYVKLPNGEYIRNEKDELPLNTVYNVKENGLYRFEISDFAGNITIEEVNITNMDREKPILNYSLDPTDWTSSNVVIKISASDNISGVDYIVIPDGSKIYAETTNYTVSKNGDYNFIARDKVGNSNTIKVKVRNIDTIKPEVEITKNPNIEWSNTDVEITIKEKDTL